MACSGAIICECHRGRISPPPNVSCRAFTKNITKYTAQSTDRQDDRSGQQASTSNTRAFFHGFRHRSRSRCAATHKIGLAVPLCQSRPSDGRTGGKVRFDGSAMQDIGIFLQIFQHHDHDPAKRPILSCAVQYPDCLLNLLSRHLPLNLSIWAIHADNHAMS